MSASIDDIGKGKPSPEDIPDWAAGSSSPEPKTQKHPDERTQDIEDRKANRELRAEFARKAYKVVKCGLYGWGGVLLISVIGNVIQVKTFSDEVLIAITTATTLNLFAAFLGVIRGLFPNKHSN